MSSVSSAPSLQLTCDQVLPFYAKPEQSLPFSPWWFWAFRHSLFPPYHRSSCILNSWQSNWLLVPLRLRWLVISLSSSTLVNILSLSYVSFCAVLGIWGPKSLSSHSDMVQWQEYTKRFYGSSLNMPFPHLGIFLYLSPSVFSVWKKYDSSFKFQLRHHFLCAVFVDLSSQHGPLLTKSDLAEHLFLQTGFTK